ncbi:MAG: hypothetical protein KJ915_09125 [Candidatus Omnitrophica bacterium]|nr:hypothetical protein [Candidatus Omnitrophota bacterium]
MVTNILCVICKDIIEDKETKMVSYINCIERVGSDKFPANLPSVSLGTAWIKDSNVEEKFKLRVKLLFPDNEEKVLLETPDNIIKGDRHRVNFVISGFPLKKEGQHRLVVEKLGQNSWEFAGSASLMAAKNVVRGK